MYVQNCLLNNQKGKYANELEIEVSWDAKKQNSLNVTNYRKVCFNNQNSCKPHIGWNMKRDFYLDVYTILNRI